MQVFINNEIHQFEQENLNLEIILQQINILDSKGIAIAINNKIISKTLWSSTLLQNNDRITLIRATQGG